MNYPFIPDGFHLFLLFVNFMGRVSTLVTFEPQYNNNSHFFLVLI